MMQARQRFEKQLWEGHGWGGENGLTADRRCIVGTLRWISGTAADSSGASRTHPDRSPWFFAYEEGIFETVAILFEDQFLRTRYGWNEYVQTNGFSAVEEVRRYQRETGLTENAAILEVLGCAEGALIGYNDGPDSSSKKMIALMTKAAERVKAKRTAIAAEMAKQETEHERLSSLNPEVTVVASREDEVAARKEYEAANGQKWDPFLYDENGNVKQWPTWNWNIKDGGWYTKLTSREKVPS